MGEVRYISDLHFGHLKLAQSRGFNTSKDHDEYFIDQWNSAVRNKDTVFILGDLTMEKSDYRFLNHLKGLKKVIRKS
jgi:calcineurin-like phosphoesterase family protein